VLVLVADDELEHEVVGGRHEALFAHTSSPSTSTACTPGRAPIQRWLCVARLRHRPQCEPRAGVQVNRWNLTRHLPGTGRHGSGPHPRRRARSACRRRPRSSGGNASTAGHAPRPTRSCGVSSRACPRAQLSVHDPPAGNGGLDPAHRALVAGVAVPAALSVAPAVEAPPHDAGPGHSASWCPYTGSSYALTVKRHDVHW
jgi:hypothetical protein